MNANDCRPPGPNRILRRALVAVLFFLLVSCSVPGAAGVPPNVVLILADDLGYGDVGYNGCRDIPTPNIDRLAAEGVILTDAHTSASVCAPSRAGLLSGRYQQRVGFECNGPHGEHGLQGEVTTFAEAMKAAGYETLGLGKWHLGAAKAHHPNRQGFDAFSGFIGGSRSYFPIENPGRNQAMQRNGQFIDEKEIGYVTDWLTDETMRLLTQRDAGKPFFVYLSYNAPHTPMHALPEDLARVEHIKHKGRRTYAAMVYNLDRNIGRLRAWLAEQGLSDNTLLLFASDNGGATSNASDNGIYRGMKGSKWEGGHRVPCLVSWPAGGLTGGGKNGMLVSTLDFMATSLAAAGGRDQVEKLGLDGRNLLPALKAGAAAQGHETLFWRRAVAAGVRQGNWKLIRIDEAEERFRALLFNLEEDPGETKDLCDAEPGKRDHLAGLLRDWESGLLPPAWREGDMWEDNQRKKHRMDVVGRDAERRLP